MCLDFKLRFVSVLHFAITRSALTSSTWHRLCLPQSLPFYLPEKIGVPYLPSPSFPPAGSSSGLFVLWPAHSVNHSLFLPQSRSCRLKVTTFAFVFCLSFFPVGLWPEAHRCAVISDVVPGGELLGSASCRRSSSFSILSVTGTFS